MAARGAVNSKGEAAPQPVKVQRYWPGKLPKGVKEAYSSDEEEDEGQQQFEKQKERELLNSIQKVDISEHEVASNPRLRRLRKVKEEIDLEPIDRRRRHAVEPEISRVKIKAESPKHLADSKTEEEEEEDERELALRRMRLRDRALAQRREEEERLKASLEETERGQSKIATNDEQEKEEESEEEDSSEYETDSEEEEDHTSRQLKKPVFIPKAHRETILERERLEKEAIEEERRLQQAIEERKKETHSLLAEKLQKEMIIEVNQEASGSQEVNDTDGLDEQAEYEAWKLRELKRIKRDKEEREAREKEQEEIERRRTMSEEQRLKEDMERVKKQREEKPNGKYKFLQKYYHKGAFYMNTDDNIYKRDYTAPTPDEAAHKELLPKVMQVKNFGRAGQTKWTHLADQDTSKKDSAWTQKSVVNKRTLHKMGGMHGGFDKPTSKKQKM